MLFEVRVVDEMARVTTLELEAIDGVDARQQALQLRYTPLAVQARKAPAFRSRSRFNVTLFAEELQMLLQAGLSLIESLDGLAERETSTESRAVFLALAARLREGDRLSSAMARQVDSFSALFVGIVRAAETTSSLAPALAKFVAYELHLRTLRERMASAAIYPTILLVVGSAVTLFLMTYVVPKFAQVYTSSGRPLPWASRLLLETGQLLNHNLPVVATATAMAVAVAWLLVRRRQADLGWLQLLAVVPGAARRVATIEMSRLFRTLSMLLEGGLPLRDALSLCSSVVFGSNRIALAQVQHRIEGGGSFSDSLSASGLSTPLALRLIRVGERVGQLGPMLERAAMFHEHETGQWIERFSKVFAPALMILISLIVGLIVVFLYIPVFDLAASFQRS